MSVHPPHPPPAFRTAPGIAFHPGPRPGVQFTERMAGWLSPASTPVGLTRKQYDDAARAGEAHGRRLELLLTVTADDIEYTVSHDDHPARFVGSATVSGLAEIAGPTLVTAGTLKLFTVDPHHVLSRCMTYDATLTAANGRPWRLKGFKSVYGGGLPGFDPAGTARKSGAFAAWRDLTRLYVTLVSGTDILAGVVTVSGRDFLRQLRTVRGVGGDGWVERFDSRTRFLTFFGSVLRDVYGGPLATGRYAPPDWTSRQTRELSEYRGGARRGRRVIPDRDSLRPRSPDGVTLKVQRYRAGTAARAPVLLAPGFGVRAASYAIDTVSTNLVEYLCGVGYDVWLLDHRASPELGATRPPFTLDHVARYDWPTAVAAVQERYPAGTPVRVLAHCLSGASFMMAALSGMLTGRVHSAVVSQLAAHPITSSLNEVKIMSGLGMALALVGVENLKVTVDVRDRLQRTLMDRLVKLYPTSDPCDNPICRRVRFVFGESYLHANLDRRTHDRIIEMFGDPETRRPATMSVRAMRHVSRMVTAGRLVDAEGHDVYLTPAAAANVDFPLTLLGGERNELFLPEGLEATCQWLGAHDRPASVVPIAGYGHMDCFIGVDAYTAVFPKIAGAFSEGRRPAAR